MSITRVRTFRVEGHAQFEPYPIEERQVGQLDIYPEYAARGPQPSPSGPELRSACYVQIDSSEGASGLFGPIFPEQAQVIRRGLTPFLIGRDPWAYEKLWDLLYRFDRHARKGLSIMAISAVDNALWDLRGKLAGQPVYRLLGGPSRERVPAYASMLGRSLEPERVRERAQTAVAEGYRAQKWFFRYGPSDGLEGMRRNVELVRTAREAVGPDIELMFDCWMGWDVTYAARMLERIAEYDVRWVEEPVQPDRIEELAQLCRDSRVPIASGEHEYTRWGFLALLQAGAVDVVQADPDWAGGLTEMTKICALASAYGRPVIPHGHSVLPALHLIASQPPATCPMAEFLLCWQPMSQYFHKTFVRPEGGSFALPSAPGLGIELDESKIERVVELE